jgi:subtilisin family serine protease
MFQVMRLIYFLWAVAQCGNLPRRRRAADVSARRDESGMRVRAGRSFVALSLVAVTLGASATGMAAAEDDIDTSVEVETDGEAIRPASGESGSTVDEDGNAVLGASPAVLASASRNGYVVQVENGAALTELVDELSADGVSITNTWKGALVGFSASLDASTAQRLREHEGVVTVEHDERIQLSGVQSGAPWNLDRIDQRRRPLDTKYSYRYTGQGVSVYVIDSGIRPTHVDFGGRANRGAYWDFGDGRGMLDCNGHGTHVAGTVGGAKWGVAKAVTIVPVKVFPCSGTTTTSIIVDAANWVIGDHQAGRPAVVNMSLGGSPSTILDDAVNRMIQDGITVVVAAGNEADPACWYSPARVPAAITVAASTSDDDDADFSNYGPCNDLFAPGVSIRSASHLSDTGSVVKDGTSMASPHVAGAAALILQRSPSATPAQVWSAIDAGATRGVLSECCDDPDKLLHITPAVTAPGAPTRVTAAVAPARGVRSGQVKLSWSPASNGGASISDYVVQRSANRRSWTTIRDGVSTARTAIISRLRNGTPYWFRVAAKNTAGLGRWSATARATPVWTPSAPRAVRAAVAPAPGIRSGQVKLSWSAPRSTGGTRIKDYVVQRSANRRSWTTIRDGVSTTRTAIISRLRTGTPYWFRVAAKNAVGLGARSVSVRATPRRG